MSVTRLLHYLAIAALLLMPLGMSGGRAMAAQQAAAAAMDHCNGDAGKTAPHRSMPDDCVAACAAIPATVGAEISAPIPFPAMAEPSPVASLDKGRGPEAAIPPPRIS